MIVLPCVIIEKRLDKQPRYMHGWLSQHASVHWKKAKSSCVVGESSCAIEKSSFYDHVFSLIMMHLLLLHMLLMLFYMGMIHIL